MTLRDARGTRNTCAQSSWALAARSSPPAKPSSIASFLILHAELSGAGSCYILAIATARRDCCAFLELPNTTRSLSHEVRYDSAQERVCAMEG
jgi:hypothetical protein